MFLIGSRTSNEALVPSLLLGGECKGNRMNCIFFGNVNPLRSETGRGITKTTSTTNYYMI